MITNVDTKNGTIWFEYKGDEISWNGKQYLSVSTGGAFETLELMDKFWDEYFEALGRE